MVRGNFKYRRFTESLGVRVHGPTLRRYCRELWSDIIKARDVNRCVLCGATTNLNSHHLISRRVRRYRYVVECGVTLCYACHTSPIVGPHDAPWKFEQMIKRKLPQTYAWWVAHRDVTLADVKGRVAYRRILSELKLTYSTQHRELRPRPGYKLWDATQNKKLVSQYLKGASLRELEQIYDISRTRIRAILTKYHVHIRTEQRKGMTARWRNRIRTACGKPLSQFTKTGELIATYACINDAAKALGIRSRTAIGNCLAGRSASCAGFTWKVNEPKPKETEHVEPAQSVDAAIGTGNTPDPACEHPADPGRVA